MRRHAARHTVTTRGVALLLAIVAVTAFLLTGCSDQREGVLEPGTETQDKGLQNPLLANSRLQCIGTKCSVTPGSGAWPRRDYSYIVTPGQRGIDRVVMGVHSTNFHPQNLILPAGWTWSLKSNTTLPHNNAAVPHGTVAVKFGSCDWTVHFHGPAMTSQFQIAYDSLIDPHTASWGMNDGTRSNWGMTVGMGQGPAHTPAGGLTGGGTGPGGSYEGPGDVVPVP